MGSAMRPSIAILLYLFMETSSLASASLSYANLRNALDNHQAISYEDLHRLAVIDQVSDYITPVRSLPTRNVKLLNGLFDYCFDPTGGGFAEKWFEQSLLDTCRSGDYYRMPVPSAFNDILSNRTARDYVGWMWYQSDTFWLHRDEYLPYWNMASWKRLSRNHSRAPNWLLQVDSINYFSIIWIQVIHDNGFLESFLVGAHVGGHLPVTMNVSSILNTLGPDQAQLRLVIAVSNQLTANTIPSGQMVNMTRYVGKPSFKFQPDFDFFNFAGIMGDVRLVQLPTYYIDEVAQFYNQSSTSDSVQAKVCLNAAPSASQSSYYVAYRFVGWPSANENLTVDDDSVQPRILTDRCELLTLCLSEQSRRQFQSRQRHNLGQATSASLLIKVRFDLYRNDYHRAAANFAGPLTKPALSLALAAHAVDSFELKLRFGRAGVTGESRRRNIVELLSSSTNSASNGSSGMQLQGFGMHHEQMFSGRTMSLPTIMKDLYLLKQMGANVIRTSHYPYSSAYLEACDELDLMVIAECPAVGLNSFSGIKLMLHKQILLEMMQRDHGHPSIVMWSLANEPQSQLPEARPYFESLLAFARDELQQFTTRAGRPLTAAIAQSHLDDKIGDLFDVLMINRYYGWYDCLGSLECIGHSLNESLTGWANKYGHEKPLIVSEFGADTVAGLHSNINEIFSEEYQRDLIEAHERLFDQLAAGRARGRVNFLGAMIWNFADFSTHESLLRVGGNRKGLFTRDRRPKLAASTVQQIYKSRPPIQRD